MRIALVGGARDGVDFKPSFLANIGSALPAEECAEVEGVRVPRAIKFASEGEELFYVLRGSQYEFAMRLRTMKPVTGEELVDLHDLLGLELPGCLHCGSGA